MVDWRLKLASIEKEFDSHEKYCWEGAIATLQGLYAQYYDNVEFSVRIIYIIYHLLVHEEITDEERMVWGNMLVDYFRETSQTFQNNAEYLFFLSRIIDDEPIGLWGTDEYSKPYEETLYYQMAQKASALEPDNKLYLWGKYVLMMNDEYAKCYPLVKEILFGTNRYLSWLQKRGYAGALVIEWLTTSYPRMYERYERRAKRCNIKAWLRRFFQR